MSPPLKVLILEDREPDAFLLAQTLKDQNLECVCERVETEADFRRALHGPLDVILADYQLQGFTALDAVRWVREAGLDIPVIIVTGALGDEAAAECIRQGAVDYILKDRPARLSSAVLAALEQKSLREARRQAEQALQLSERRFRQVFEASPVGLAVLDATSRVTVANAALAHLLRKPETDLTSAFFQDLLAHQGRPLFARAWEELLSGKDGSGADAIPCAVLGPETIWATLRLVRLHRGTDVREYALVVCQDITSEVRARELALRRSAIAHATATAADTFLSTDDWNEALTTFLSRVGTAVAARCACVLRTDTTGRLTLQQWWPPEAEDCAEHVVRIVRETQAAKDEMPFKEPRVMGPYSFGKDVQASEALSDWLLVAPVQVHRARWGYLAIVKAGRTCPWHQEELAGYANAATLLADAIQGREAARRLRASEQRFRSLVSTSRDAVISADADGFVTGWNERAAELFGYTEEEALGSPVLSLIAPPARHREWREAGIRPLVPGEKRPRPYCFDTIALKRDGSEFPVEVAVAAVPDPEQPMISLFVRDLSAQKAMESALEEARQEEMRAAAEIQEQLLVETPTGIADGFRVATEARPGRVVSGDFVWILPHNDDVLDLVLGDVMGKGLAAALVGAVTKNQLHEVVRRLSVHLRPFQRLPTPREALMALNERLSKQLSKLESFVTVAYLRLDRATQTYSFVGCGHPPLVHLDVKRNVCSFVSSMNVPIGVLKHDLFTMQSGRFDFGDLFFVYTDGILEATSPTDEQYGEDRLRAVLLQNLHADPSTVISSVLHSVHAFQGRDQFDDDVTCVAVSVHKSTREQPLMARTLEVPGTLDQLTTIRSFVEGFLQELPDAPIAEEATDMLLLAVHEGVCNVIQHAHERRPEFDIQMVAEAYPDRVEIRIYDSGSGMEMDRVPEPELGSTEEQPLGVYFIKRSVDDYQYTRDALGRNCLRLVVKRQANNGR